MMSEPDFDIPEIIHLLREFTSAFEKSAELNGWPIPRGSEPEAGEKKFAFSAAGHAFLRLYEVTHSKRELNYHDILDWKRHGSDLEATQLARLRESIFELNRPTYPPEMRAAIGVGDEPVNENAATASPWQTIVAGLNEITSRLESAYKVRIETTDVQSLEGGRSMIKTVVELDLVGFSTVAKTLEDGLGVETIPTLMQQIQSFVDQGLSSVGASRPDAVMQTTGDGAILVFDQPSKAHHFADVVQQAARNHNTSKPNGIGKRVFRIGIATGELMMQPKTGGGFDIAGMTIARAVRLEGKANPGEVLVDAATFAGLDSAQQRLYSASESIPGKREERFEARRCVLNPDGVSDASFFADGSSATDNHPVVVSNAATSAGPRSSTLVRREILIRFTRLRPHQFDDLMFLLLVPIEQRPPDTISLERRKTELLGWAEGTPDGLENLDRELEYLVGASANSHPQ